MINYRLSDDPIAEDETDEYKDQAKRESTRCTIFLGYTSNQASCETENILDICANTK